MKRKIGIVVLLIVVLGLWLGIASAGEKIQSWVTDANGNPLYQIWQEDDWLYYYESEDGNPILLQFNDATETTVTLPVAFDGKPVTKILSQATRNIVHAIIPGGMSVLPEGSFSRSTNLRSVTFESGVTGIGENAFYQCYALEEVTFPDTLTHIGSQAFIDCTSLIDVTLSPSDPCVIGQNAFYGCTELMDLTLNPNITVIDEAAFYGCASLSTVSLPNTLTSIGSGAFSHLEGTLAELKIPASVTSMDLPIVDNECIMVVKDSSPALALLLSEDNCTNYRIEGESDTPEVTEGTTVAERVSAIVSAVIRDGMNDYQKALALHDYLTQHAQYNVGYENESTDPYHATNHEADGVLLHGTGVCESYTKAYGLLLDAVGIENDAQISETHTWNLVKLDGEWYHVDVTWDDPTLKDQGTLETDGSGNLKPRSGREGHHYFCIPDYALEGVSEHAFEGVNKPEATGYALNYDYQHGGLDSRLAALKAGIETHLQDGETEFSLTSSDLPAFNPDTANGILDRTALTVMRNTEYAGPNDTSYTVDAFTYDGTTLSLTMKVSGEAPANACGPNLTWSFENGTLTISGTGEMYEFEDGKTPWNLAGLSNQITELNLEEGVTRLTTFAFEYCAMSEVSIPNSVLSIDQDCFLQCPNLTSISIPAATSSIHSGAVYASLNFREITVSNENPYYTVKDGMLMNKAATEIILIPNALETVVIPENITHLPEYGFYLGRYTNLTIHTGIEGLDDYAFMDTVIQNVTLASGFETIQSNTFYGAKIVNLFLPSTLTTVQTDAFKTDTYTNTSLYHIWYDGSRASFDTISVAEEGNAAFLNAEKHYLVITAEITEIPELIDLDEEGAEYTFSYTLDGGAAPYVLQYEVESFDSDENTLSVEAFTEENLPAAASLTLAGINENAVSVMVRIVSVQGASGRSETPAESDAIPVQKIQALPDPVIVTFPEGEELVLGQEIEVSWALLDGYSYESASITFWERRSEENGNFWQKRQTFDLSGNSGTFRYTPKAANSMNIAVVFKNQNWSGNGFYQEIKTYTLTGTPAVSLVTADSSLTLNKEDGVMDFAYQISGGTGAYQRLFYQFVSSPDGSIDSFIPEGEILSPESSGTLTLETLLPGSYLLFMTVEDGSGWTHAYNKTYTVSETDGSRDIKVHIPTSLYTQDAPQAVKWSLTGGYTPFYCNVELNFLDENRTPLTEEPFVYEDGLTSGEALLSLMEPVALTAVFTITTQDPNGPRGELITLDPIEVPITVEKAVPRLDLTYSVDGEVLQPGDSFAYDKTLTVDWTLSNVPEGWALLNETQMNYQGNQAYGWTQAGDLLDENTVLTDGAASGRWTISPKTANNMLVMIYLHDPETDTWETLCEDNFTITGCTLEPVKVTVSCDADIIQRPGRLDDGTIIPRSVKVHYQVTGGSGNYAVTLQNGEKTSGIDWYWLTEEGFDESLPSGKLETPEGDLILTASENVSGPIWLCIDVEDEDAGLFLLGGQLLEFQITDYVPILSEITQIPEKIVLGSDSDSYTFSYAITGGSAPYSLTYEVQSYGTDDAPLPLHSMDAENLPASGTLALSGVDADASSVKVRIINILDTEGQGIEPAESGAIPVKASEIVTIDVSGLTAFTLPEGLTEIEDEAFLAISAEYVLCPDGLTIIGKNAFSGCENLICVSLPDDIDANGIGPGAFPDGVIFLCTEGSSAWQWAETNHLKRMKR